MRVFKTRTSLCAALLLAGGLLFPTLPARAADEGVQVALLKQLFRVTEPEWLAIMKDNVGALDRSFFERCDARIRWSAENNQVDDALRFAMVADTASDALGKLGSYRLQLALAFQKVGNDPLARQLLDNILLTHPEYNEARYMRAIYIQHDGDTGMALEEFQKLVDAGYRVADCEAFKGIIYEGMEKPELAIASYKKALALNPQHAIAKPRLELIAKQFVPPNGSDNMFQNVPLQGVAAERGVDPKLFAEYLRLGEAALKAKRFSEAETQLKNACAANPKSAVAWSTLGTLEYRMGRTQDAANYLLASVKFDPNNAANWRYLGCACERLFDSDRTARSLEQAKAFFDKALKLSPNDPVSAMAMQRLATKVAGPPATGATP